MPPATVACTPPSLAPGTGSVEALAAALPQALRAYPSAFSEAAWHLWSSVPFPTPLVPACCLAYYPTDFDISPLVDSALGSAYLPSLSLLSQQ